MPICLMVPNSAAVFAADLSSRRLPRTGLVKIYLRGAHFARIRRTSGGGAMSFRPFQKASSMLTLVLCPAITIERLRIGDFIDLPPFQCGVSRRPLFLRA